MAHDAARVKSELARILASDQFKTADRHSAMLRFVVERALDGGGPAKEYEIGVDVLGRPTSYDPRTDPIVRVEMRQLRLKLAQFYSTSAQTTGVRIDLPKGRYEAVFATVAAPPAPPAAVVRPEHGSRHALAIVALLVALTVTLVWAAGRRSPLPTDLLDATPSVAVLPFANLSGDASQDYFSDGLAEEIMSALMRVHGLHVAGRTSAFAFKAREVSPAEAAKELRVNSVLTGSVRRDGRRVRVVASLHDAAGLQIWSRAYDDETTETIAVQERIARAVAEALRVRLDATSGQPFVKRSNDDAQAYDLYLKARALAHSRQTANVQASIDLFQQAIGRDADYALAYAGLADAHGVLAFNGQVTSDPAIAKARAAAARALALDPTLGEAVAHLASLDGFVDWNWTAAERGFRRALELSPSHPRIHAWYGQLLLVGGKFSDAIGELLLAQRLDPLAGSISYALGEAYLYFGKPEAAITQARRLLAADPQSWGGRNLLARAALQAGRREMAMEALARSRGELWADVLSLIVSGETAEARQLLDGRSATIAATQPFTLASLYAQAGDQEAAMSWLHRAFEIRQVDLAYLGVDPAFASVRGVAAYHALLTKLGLKRDLTTASF
jgi:serine/threonine-protein kinase